MWAQAARAGHGVFVVIESMARDSKWSGGAVVVVASHGGRHGWLPQERGCEDGGVWSMDDLMVQNMQIVMYVDSVRLIMGRLQIVITKAEAACDALEVLRMSRGGGAQFADPAGANLLADLDAVNDKFRAADNALVGVHGMTVFV